MPNREKITQGSRQIRRVTNIGLGINSILTVLKVSVGIMAGSMALVADGIHSFSDMATDIAVLLGAYFGAKQPDTKHPYGHGWAETFSAVFVAVVLLLLGAGMIYKAAENIAGNVHFRPASVVLVVAGLSVVVKEFLYRITKKTAIRLQSSMLYANAWHHRSDALSSVAVVLAVIAYKRGFSHADQVATIIVALMIVLVAARVIGDCLGQLTARAVDSKTSEQIERIIASQGQIRQWHKMRTRIVGRELFLDLHILVDPDLTITEAHSVSETLEAKLNEQIKHPINIMVHIEPCYCEEQ
ncbi:MAG: cation diffusion facilitator family transporter [Planctomycetes bacterium]|nr:cation diffusion facilitator family transporter [Planctomycetota bacterium]